MNLDNFLILLLPFTVIDAIFSTNMASNTCYSTHHLDVNSFFLMTPSDRVKDIRKRYRLGLLKSVCIEVARGYCHSRGKQVL